jgi:hypothetical protein
MSNLSEFPIPLARYLRVFAARRRIFMLIRAFGLGISCWLVWLLVMCLVDRWARLPQELRLVFLTVGICLSCLCFVWAAWRAVRSISWNAAAARIESGTPIFAEQLQTVTSYLLAPQPNRGSSLMVRQTLSRVEDLLQRAPISQLLPWRLLLGPWLSVACVAAVIAALSLLPNLHLHQLMARALHPNRELAPVTMTQLEVSPRDAQVSQGGLVTVSALVSGPEASRDAELYLSADHRSWSRAAMKLMSATTQESRFEFAIPAIDRDLDFYVRGGDARSSVYRIKVQRVPMVSEFQIRYDYPEYANHAPATVINTDGRIEGLAGSTATVTIVASEPLRWARWILDGQPLEMQATAQSDRWTIALPVAVSGSCALEMMSVDGVAGRGPVPMELHAIRDEPPQPQVVQPATDLQLSPTDASVIAVAASDDFGLASMEVEIGVNGQVVARASIPLMDRPPHREAEFTLQPAVIGATVGDVVTVTVSSEDTDGQSTVSDERRIFIVPSTIWLRLYEQATELRRSIQIAKAWEDSLGKAQAALAAARSVGGAAKQDADAWGRANRSFTVAGDAATTLRQSLLRALLLSDPGPINAALASWADDTMTQLIEPGRTMAATARGMDGVATSLQSLLARAQKDRQKLITLQRGVHAQIALLELGNLQSLEALPPSINQVAGNGRAGAVEHLRQSLNAWLSQEELSMTPQLQEVLQRRMHVPMELEAGLHDPDQLTWVKEWTAHLSKQSGMMASEYPARLALSAQVQAIRPDGDLTWSRDLLLASRAASVLAQFSPTARESDRPNPKSKSPDPLAEFQTAITDLVADHQAPDNPARHAAAEESRRHLRSIPANLGENGANGDLFDPAVMWAIEAGADILQQNYSEAQQADGRLVQQVAGWSPQQSAVLQQQAARSLSQIRLIDQLLDQQSDVQRLLEQSSLVDASAEQSEITEAMRRLHIGHVAILTGVAPTTQISVQTESAAATYTVSQPPPEVAMRHPWLAAVWHGQAASELLAAAQVKPATEHMQQVIEFLKQTRLYAVHRAALLRLAQAPSLAWVFEPDEQGPTGSPVAGAATLPTTRGLARRLGIANSPYREELKIYFDALAKAQREKK